MTWARSSPPQGSARAVLDGLDTPTLLGLWASAPYLHGSASTSLEVLTTANGAGGTEMTRPVARPTGTMTGGLSPPQCEPLRADARVIEVEAGNDDLVDVGTQRLVS